MSRIGTGNATVCYIAPQIKWGNQKISCLLPYAYTRSKYSRNPTAQKKYTIWSKNIFLNTKTGWNLTCKLETKIASCRKEEKMIPSNEKYKAAYGKTYSYLTNKRVENLKKRLNKLRINPLQFTSSLLQNYWFNSRTVVRLFLAIRFSSWLLT